MLDIPGFSGWTVECVEMLAPGGLITTFQLKFYGTEAYTFINHEGCVMTWAIRDGTNRIHPWPISYLVGKAYPYLADE